MALGQSKKIGTLEINSFIEINDTDQQITFLNDHADCFTYVCIFSYRITTRGLIPPIHDHQLVSTALKNKIAPIMVLSNYLNGRFDSELLHEFLNNKSRWNFYINNLIHIIKVKNYYGVNIDFECVLPEDRALLNAFLESLKNRLKSHDIILIISAAPKYSDEHTSPKYSPYDYGAYNQIADRVILMTYEWGWCGGPPMPIAPANQIRNVLDYAVSKISGNKIMMGVPLYGYDWEIPYRNGSQAKTLTLDHALKLAKKFNTCIHYDTISQSPYYNYFDNTEKQHMVWFENEQSLKVKYELARIYKLQGVSFWGSIEKSIPQNWQTLNQHFEVKKVL